jgi:hypothetical protein
VPNGEKCLILLPLQKALKSGLQPCKICDPPFRAVSGIISKPKKTAGTNQPANV